MEAALAMLQVAEALQLAHDTYLVDLIDRKSLEV